MIYICMKSMIVFYWNCLFLLRGIVFFLNEVLDVFLVYENVFLEIFLMKKRIFFYLFLIFLIFLLFIFCYLLRLILMMGNILFDRDVMLMVRERCKMGKMGGMSVCRGEEWCLWGCVLERMGIGILSLRGIGCCLWCWWNCWRVWGVMMKMVWFKSMGMSKFLRKMVMVKKWDKVEVEVLIFLVFLFLFKD